MTKFVQAFLADESGASAAEYALILAVVGVTIGAAALTLGKNVGLSIANASANVGKCGDAASKTTTASSFNTTTNVGSC